MEDIRTVRAYITNLGKYNEGELLGEWVTFPITEDEEKELFRRIHISSKPDEDGNIYEEYFMTDYEDYGIDLFGLFGEYPSIDTLNELAEMLSGVSDCDVEILQGLINDGYYGTGLDGIHEAIDGIDDWYKVTDPEDYARELFNIDGFIENYIDWERLGKDLIWEQENIEIEDGYLIRY